MLILYQQNSRQWQWHIKKINLNAAFSKWLLDAQQRNKTNYLMPGYVIEGFLKMYLTKLVSGPTLIMLHFLMFLQ